MRRVYRRVAFPGGYFRKISLTEDEIRTRQYEGYLYGSREAWRGHGAFQIFFLKAMGLQPSHRFLDVGCGPLRGGLGVVAYLDAGNYCGVDFNESFLRAAALRVDEAGLASKAPVLRIFDDTTIDRLPGEFDFALAFSVLNHCDAAQRRRFLIGIPGRLKVGAPLYVSHASWFQESALARTKLVLKRRFARAADVGSDVSMSDFGWRQRRPPVFPILELERTL
jgi:SAM-dependent methyltransferase